MPKRVRAISNCARRQPKRAMRPKQPKDADTGAIKRDAIVENDRLQISPHVHAPAGETLGQHQPEHLRKGRLMPPQSRDSGNNPGLPHSPGSRAKQGCPSTTRRSECSSPWALTLRLCRRISSLMLRLAFVVTMTPFNDIKGAKTKRTFRLKC